MEKENTAATQPSENTTTTAVLAEAKGNWVDTVVNIVKVALEYNQLKYGFKKSF